MWDGKIQKRVGAVVKFPVEAILPNPAQPRRYFAYDRLLSLAQSIGENGLLQPLTVTMQDGVPTLVAGERRLRACKLAGLKTVPCIVVKQTDEQSAVLALVENLQREDLHFFEQAEGIRRLIDDYHLTQEQAAARLGFSQPTVANKLRLLAFSPAERDKLAAANASERHARALLGLPETARAALMVRMVAENWTVARTEREVAHLKEVENAPRRRVTPLVKDVRLFFNTVDRAVETMRQSGVAVNAEKRQGDGFIEWVVRIPDERKAR